ncbi:MAG: signal peptidase I [Candidatus Saganbacteria bacterium]|uniref:Signal peptidase I n=1 Tax=Candidatus Saganbacteria bacterium TaxID=2575572 RepID=A0A833L467_UNCSA|nr:MAG: signal peptidase I [Candidatus Saganbacteria bacterium]
MQKTKHWAKEWFETIIIALALALFIRAFFIQVFWIPSGSMEPSLNINDRIIVNKLAYGLQNPLFESFKEKKFLYIIPNPLYQRQAPTSNLPYFINFNKGPKRFDVIVFKMYDTNNDRKDLIKRLIGLPGEKLEVKKGIVYINGKELKEPHPINNNYFDLDSLPAAFGPVVIPKDSYFVMGDNRPNSADSRYWGFLPRNNIIGPAFLRIWPLFSFGAVPK